MVRIARIKTIHFQDMDWIHCNACCYQPSSEKRRKFLLTSCGHIYCNICVEAGTKPACRVCNTECTAIQLESQMAPNIQHYFSDPEDLMRKALQVFTFQKGHRQRLSNLCSSTTHDEHLAIATENKALKAKLAQYTQHIALLEQNVSKLKKTCTAYAAILTPVMQQPKRSSPAITPNKHYLSSSPASSQRSSYGPVGKQTAVGEKRISPHFSPVGFLTPGSGSPAFFRSVQGETAKKISPRERFLNFKPY
jgi:hypothetical protein